MKNTLKYIFLLIGFSLISCQGLVDDINESPNQITTDELTNAELFLNGVLLANTVAQAGHLNRISAMWSGQLTGLASLYSNIYGYSISTAESVSTWSRIYVGVIPNARLMREKAPDDELLVGISKVVEAHAIGTAANLFGDIPYSEISQLEIEDPKFESQMSVLNAMLSLLDDAIADLTSADSRSLSTDIHFNGNATKWIAAANTLKARYHMHMKDYSSAYDAALKGIQSAADDMLYRPQGDPSVTEGDKNLFYEILEGSRADDIGTGDSYMMQLLDPNSAVSRNNDKTNETARFHYAFIDESSGSANKGVIAQFEPHPLITYRENQLILAEAGARMQGFDTGLTHLNDYRTYLNDGGYLNENFIDSTFLYEAYVTADFENGGMENMDGISTDMALLREIIEERYISGFGMFMPFDDARRLRKSDEAIAVPFPLNPGGTQHPERMPYSDDELNTNGNAPKEDPGIYTKTEVNQ